jgi:hypothetical protein
VLSLIITPAVHFFLSHEEESLSPEREELHVA